MIQEAPFSGVAIDELDPFDPNAALTDNFLNLSQAKGIFHKYTERIFIVLSAIRYKFSSYCP